MEKGGLYLNTQRKEDKNNMAVVNTSKVRVPIVGGDKLPEVNYGDTGTYVSELQRGLKNAGYNISIDGIFGTDTLMALRRYQRSMGLTDDGIAGKNTWNALQGGNTSSNSSSTSATKSYSDIDLSKYDSGYQKSQDVIDSEQKKVDAESSVANYGDFSYSNQADFDEIMNKILNREEFSYNLNGDALYQQYKDNYVQQGKMAMQDTMGQAAAMTGGYGNSYAATAGNQAYQASLENLNDIVPELYQMAYDKYNQEGQDLYNQYSMLSDDRNTEYGTWNDKYNRLVSDRDYYGNEANNAYAKDYGEWSDQRDFDTNQYWNETNFGYQQERDDIADEQWLTSFEEGKRQYDESMDFQREQYEYQKSQASSSGGSGGGGGGSDFQKATFARIDDNGNYVFYLDGKERTYAAGVNPYTGTKNSDCANGTFSNGYQPDNINGDKLSKSGITDVVNGVTQNVWKTSDGKLWIWDGTKNKYLAYEE